jgi:pimeloyl-ACP methyl ester carboxylesterase
MEREFTASDGVALRADVLDGWRRTPVLLLHGGGQTRHAWGETAETLAGRGWSTIALDLRGHGDSDWSPQADYRLEVLADDVRTVVAQLDAPPVLVGASLGGISALLALISEPASPAVGLVLVDVAHRFNPGGTQRIVEFMRKRPDGFDNPSEAMADIADYLPHRTPRSDAAGVRKNLRLRDGRWRWHWDPSLFESMPALQSERGRALEARLRSGLEQLDLPVMLVRGAISDVVTAEIAAEFDALSPSTEVVEVPDAAHMVAGDSNEPFTDAVTVFLERL